MTVRATGGDRLVESLLAGAATSVLALLLGFVFLGLRNPLAVTSLGIIGGLAWWVREDLRSRRAFALVAAMPVAPILGVSVLSPTFTLRVVQKEPGIVLLAAFLHVVMARLAWAELASSSTRAGIGAAGAWAIVAGVAAWAVAVLAVLLAYATGNVGV